MNMLKRLLALLAAYLCLGPDPDPDPPLDPDPPADPPADEPDPLEDLLDETDPPADPPRSDEDVAALRARAERAEREREDSRREVEALRRQSTLSPPPQSEADRLYQQEEARLRAADCTDMERWQITSNRELRASRQNSDSALREARELADQTQFNGLMARNALAKKYASRVEDKLQEIRRGGGNLARAVVLKMLVGDDLVEGRVKSKKRDSAGAGGGGGGEGSRVPRNAPPVSRSDVRARSGGQSERDKRRARLEGQNI